MKYYNTRFFSFAFAMIFSAVTSQAATIVGYDFDDATTDPSTGPLADVAVTNFLAGSGFESTEFTGNGKLQVNGAGVSGNSAAENAAAGEMFWFQVSAEPGFLLNLETITLEAWRQSASPDRLTVFATPFGGERLTIVDTAVLNKSYDPFGGPGNLSGNSELQNISSAVFEFVFHGNSQGLGFNHIDNIVLEGTTIVPEPGTYALLLGSFSLACVALRRRRR